MDAFASPVGGPATPPRGARKGRRAYRLSNAARGDSSASTVATNRRAWSWAPLRAKEPRPHHELAFKEWLTIFPNATCATALIDRLIHHADVIGIEGKSYHLREAEDGATARKDGAPTPNK